MIGRWEHIFLQSSVVSSTKKLQTAPDLFSLLRKAVIHAVNFFINSPLCLLLIFLLKVLLLAEKYNYIYKYEITSSWPYINQCIHLDTKSEDEKDILNVCEYPTLSWDFRMNPELTLNFISLYNAGNRFLWEAGGHSGTESYTALWVQSFSIWQSQSPSWDHPLDVPSVMTSNVCLRVNRSRTTHSIVFYHPGFLHGGILNAL